MPSTLAVDERRAWVAFLQSHNRLIRLLDDELEHEHGLSLAEFEVLLHLKMAGEEGMRMGDLGQAVLLSPSGITRLVDRMAANGQVTRCGATGDGRGVVAKITDGGSSQFRSANRTHRAGIHRHFLDRLAPSELDELATILEKLGGRNSIVEAACETVAEA